MQVASVNTTSYLTYTGKVSQSKRNKRLMANAKTNGKEIEKDITSKANECIEAGRKDTVQKDPVMNLYKSICEKHPDVSFRLVDMEASSKYEKQHGTDCCPWLGYNNSMNQVGDNFGKMSQKSVEIDAAVLQKSLDDPEYYEEFMFYLEEGLTDSKYNEWRNMAYDQGATNMCLGFVDDNGHPVKCATNANCEFSTEEDIRKRWGLDVENNALLKKFESLNEELLDDYMNLLSEHTQELKEKLILYK